MKKFRLWLVSSALLTALAQTSLAACPADGAKPMNIGPFNPQTTFPLWVQDSEGLALEICPGTDAANCISVPPFIAADFPGDPDAAAKAALSQQIGFGDEGFWASAETSIPLPGGGQALLVSAVEAAFLPDFADGNQFPFTRLRLRIDIPQDGTYVVTHPWGQITYDIVGAANSGDINDSFDIPFVADEVGYQGRIGPILTWETFPDDPLLSGGAYIGTLAADRPVKGSPCGTNYFRIDGPNIGGNGIDFIQTNLFTVTGKVYTGALPTPVEVGQVTYSRAASGRVSVFAEAPTQAVVSFSGGADLPAGAIPMTGDGSGRFFGSVTLAPAATLPAEITVTASNAAVGSSPADVIAPLVDLVTITRAEFDYATGDLNIEARSSDQFAPPTLSALGQNLTNGSLSTNLIVAPPTVTVSSSAGGSATIPVTVIHTP